MSYALNSGNVQIPVAAQIMLAHQGFAFGTYGAPTSGDAIKLVQRMPGQISFKGVGDKDVLELANQNFITHNITIPSLRNDIPAILNALNLSRDYIEARIKLKQGLFYNYVDNNADLLTPNGSRALGSKITFELSKTKRTLTYDLMCDMFNEENTKLFDATFSASGHAGSTHSTGVGSLALTDVGGYDRTHNLRASIFQVKQGSNDMGVFKSCDFKLETGGTADNFGRTLNRYADLTVTIERQQTGQADLAQTVINNNSDLTYYIKSGYDTIKFTGGCIRPMPDSMIKEGEFIDKLVLGGRVYYNNDWATPDTIDGLSDPTTLEFKQLYA